jgi:hypothetical protein
LLATICATADFRPSTIDADVPIVTVLPPATIWLIAPMYCVVVGELRLVSLPFHNATSWATITPLTVSTRSFACR